MGYLTRPPNQLADHDEAVKGIVQAYEYLEHQLGWRFLYFPASTLYKDTEMLFIGINPGGARYYPPVESVEEDNAYRIERWGERGTLNHLQLQVRRLYEVLSKKLGNESGVSLMDHTLAANFCPFRSRSWETLPRKAKSITFSRGLWDYLFDDVSPSVVVCLPDAPFKHFEEVLSGKGYRKTEALQQPVGWGNVTYSQVRFRLDEEELLMVKLPHLSRDTESSVGPGAVINRTSPV